MKTNKYIICYNREIKKRREHPNIASKNDNIWHIFIKNIQYINKLFDIKKLFGGNKSKRKRGTKRRYLRKNKRKTKKMK
jgi:hypothetical protein